MRDDLKINSISFFKNNDYKNKLKLDASMCSNKKSAL